MSREADLESTQELVVELKSKKEGGGKEEGLYGVSGE